MQWTEKQLKDLPARDGFRLRSENMTRLEVFSDTAFAFALTMLVVSVGTIPKDLPELIVALKSVPAFALSFAQISFFWWAHRSWSQRYGLEGRIPTVLTLALIFTVLVYVYPLRLLFSSLCAFLTNGWLPSEYKVDSAIELTSLFAIYAIGYFMLTLVMSLLYWDAYRNRHKLGLNEFETQKTKFIAKIWIHHPIFGALVTLIALFGPQTLAVNAGFFFVGMFITIFIHKSLTIRKHPELA